jgi:hypothetical protein
MKMFSSTLPLNTSDEPVPSSNLNTLIIRFFTVLGVHFTAFRLAFKYDVLRYARMSHRHPASENLSPLAEGKYTD